VNKKLYTNLFVTVFSLSRKVINTLLSSSFDLLIFAIELRLAQVRSLKVFLELSAVSNFKKCDSATTMYLLKKD